MAGIDIHSSRARHVGPYVFELAIWSEHLDALIFAVGNVNIAVAIGADLLGKTELSRFVPRLSPRAQQSAIGRLLMHLGVAVAVGYEQVAGARMDRHVYTNENSGIYQQRVSGAPARLSSFG
jgi:hypothetical protein